jgi:ABC-type Na+ efflux pump permease subunit
MRDEKRSLWIPIALVVLLVAVAAVAYTQHSAKSALEQRVATLESQIHDDIQKLQANDTALKSDVDVVTKHVGVTDQELASARSLAEKLRKEHEKTQEQQAQLASAVAKKADSEELAAARAEAATKVAEVQKESDTKITSVSGDVKTVATNLETTRQDLAASRRDLVDVKNALTDQIARNSSELAALRLKGEHNFVEFDIKKGKKNEMQRVGDIRVELRDADAKKQKYGIMIQVDDKTLEKKDKLVNEPVQFLVGREQSRYEIVVNKVEKDRIIGYLSTPKDKTVSAERAVK